VIVPIGGSEPRIAADVWVHASAYIIGDVEIGAESSVWFQSVVRGDVERVRIGRRTNLQDHVTIHVTHDRWPTILGDRVTIGHRAMLHGCTIADDVLVGIGAIVLDGVEIGSETLVGAGALVVPGTKIPPRSLALGSPAKVVRELRAEEIARIHESADLYVGYAARYRTAGI
jgi:carbonic anhydrase/acetyltransferase-like protein (isoleucine patch superfamily)